MKSIPTVPAPPRPHAGDAINETLMRRIVDAVRNDAMRRPSTPGAASRLAVTMRIDGQYPSDPDNDFVFPFRWVGLAKVTRAANGVVTAVPGQTTGQFLQSIDANALEWSTQRIGPATDSPDGMAVNAMAVRYGATGCTYVSEGQMIEVSWNGSFYEFSQMETIIFRGPVTIPGSPSPEVSLGGIAVNLHRVIHGGVPVSLGNKRYKYRTQPVRDVDNNQITAMVYNLSPSSFTVERFGLARPENGAPIVDTVFC